MVFIKSIIVCNPVCKFNVNRRISCFHQFQIYKQPPRTAITIYKRMNAFKFNMEPRKPGNDMFGAVSIIFQQLLLYQILNKVKASLCPTASIWSLSGF